MRLKTRAGRSVGEVQAAGERHFTLADRAGAPVDVPYEAIVRANLIDEG